jgi:hypothetical protein
MPHYKNGRQAKVGDPVIGTVFNTKGTVSGTLMSVTPGSDFCSCLVGFLVTNPIGVDAAMDSAPPMAAVNKLRPVGHKSEQHGTVGQDMSTYFCQDYSECKHLYHADDALDVTQKNAVPYGWTPPPPLEPAVPTPPPVDNAHVADGCEKFSSPTPAA